MKRFILPTLAVAAFGIGGVAHADLIDGVGNTISRIFGVPYDPTPAAPSPTVSVYTDAYGRAFQVDAAGRHMPLDRYGSYRDQWGRTVYLGPDHRPAYIMQNGQLTAYSSVPSTYAMGAAPDLDRDGVADMYDRWPNDPRYR